MEPLMRRYLTESEQTKLLATIRQFSSVQARRDAAWVRLLLTTGCRIGEFSRLTVKQARMALVAGWLFIPKAQRKGKHMDHQVPITAPMREDLQALLKLHWEMGGDGTDTDLLILTRRHLGMSVRGFQDRLAVWCDQCGIEASPHWLRHSRAMNIMRRSTSSDPRGLVQGALGHADISSSGIYTRMSKEELAAQLNAVDGGRRVAKRDVRAVFEGVA